MSGNLHIRRFVLALAAMLLAGCGFRPLHATNGTSAPAASEALSGIAVAPARDRIGQLVRNALLDRLTPYGAPDSAPYRLELDLDGVREGYGFRPDEAITRENYRLTAAYRLVEAGSDNVLVEGVTRSNMAYDIVQSDFANFAAARDAESRTAEEVAATIALRLALHFRSTAD